MLDGIKSSQHVIQHSAHQLLSVTQGGFETTPKASALYLEPGEIFEDYNTVSKQKVLVLKEDVKTPVIIHNPEAHPRTNLYTITVSSPYLLVSIT